MATVYLGRISGAGGFQRFVAIKRLHPHLAREPEFIQMFLDEARLAARIHHPNVVPILEIGANPQGYYLVMEYVEGGTLGHLIGRSAASDEGEHAESAERQKQRVNQRVPVHVGARIVIDMLNGLHAAHELADDDGNPLGIVHRDVSPQNVLVGVDGSARLSDFGVARATSRLSTTQAGQLKGKLAYMAPEQARGTKDIDRRADVFAAGVVLWETIAGRRLFKGDGEADTFNKVLNDPIPQISEAMPSIPPALAAVLDRALQRDREARFPTAGAFAEELEEAVRQVADLGTHKDVAAYLYAVLGSDIAQQRDAVRSWISRDASRPRSLSTPPPPLAVPSTPLMSRVGLRGSLSGSTLTPSSDRNAAPLPVFSSGRLPENPPSLPPPPVVAPSPSRARLWLWGLLLAAGVAATAGWMVLHGKPPASAQGPAPAHALAPALVTASVPASASASVPVPALTPPPAPTPHAKERSVASPGAPVQGTAPSTAIPEDIVRNPYR